MAKILFVEDDRDTATEIIAALEFAGHVVEWTHDGTEGYQRLGLYKYEMAILDWKLPGESGVEICRNYRLRGGAIPILMLTGMSEVRERVAGLDAGADDYLVKPFAPKELVARVKTLLRRPPLTASDVISIGALSIDLNICKVFKGVQEIPLRPKEFAMLSFFMRNPNKPFLASDLLDRVWSSESDSTEDAVRQCLFRLRKKIDDDSGTYFVTVKGIGFMLRNPPMQRNPDDASLS